MIRQLVEVHPVRRADSHLFECSSREAGTVLALRRRAIINRRSSEDDSDQGQRRGTRALFGENENRNPGGLPQNGDWHEFRRLCETSCLYPLCPAWRGALDAICRAGGNRRAACVALGG